MYWLGHAALFRKYCLHCKIPELVKLPESDWLGSFYGCPQCGRNFTKRLGKSLCDRWQSPKSFVLHEAIFYDAPQKHIDEIAAKFIISMKNATTPENEKNFNRNLLLIIDDIDEEINNPIQRVKDILDLNCRSEKRIREFLAGVSIKLKGYQAGSNS